MEEKNFSSEAVEEVIDLFDIVPSEEGQDDEIIDLSADDREKCDDAGDVLDLTEFAEPHLPEEEGFSVEAEASAEEPAAVPGPAVPSVYVDEDSFLRLTSELEARILALEEARLAEVQAAEQKIASFKENAAAQAESFEARLAALEQVQAGAVQALEARLVSAEEKLEALEGRAEAMRQELAEHLSHFFEDPSARLALEEMVSRMVEARLPSVSETENAVEASREEESRRAVIETVDELTLHVGELEKRVAEWEERCEQESALAAARVIREEIAAMKAGAARMAR